MIHMTMLHWIVVVAFFMVFLILTILSLKEKVAKTRTSMIFSSFLLVSVGIGFSLFALDKYTKKGKLIAVSQQRDYRTKNIIIKGKVKNIGNFKIGYCNVEVRMLNDLSSKKGRLISYFKPSKSLDGLFGSKEIKGNIVLQEFKVIKNLGKNNTQSFKVSMKYPSYFKNPTYKYKLYCH